MKQSIASTIHLTSFHEPYPVMHLSSADRGLPYANAYLAEQLLLARNLLRVESIQRAEALEVNEAIHRVKRPPSNVRFISDFRQSA